MTTAFSFMNALHESTVDAARRADGAAPLPMTDGDRR
jgi:hypothetical protein